MKYSYRHLSPLFQLLQIILLLVGNNEGIRRCQALSSISMPPLTTTTGDHLPLARNAMDYFDRSTDPFHAVKSSVDMVRTITKTN
ncbi:MAG: hypothetical protein ACI8RD_012476 [Bacillariaceae sp.]|jgi:hypothetical protein